MNAHYFEIAALSVELLGGCSDTKDKGYAARLCWVSKNGGLLADDHHGVYDWCSSFVLEMIP